MTLHVNRLPSRRFTCNVKHYFGRRFTCNVKHYFLWKIGKACFENVVCQSWSALKGLNFAAFTKIFSIYDHNTKGESKRDILMAGSTLADVFSKICKRKTTYINSCLLFCTHGPFGKGICSIRKEFAWCGTNSPLEQTCSSWSKFFLLE